MIEALVLQVIDGDTIRVARDGNVEIVRLIGIDTPEIRRPEECFGKAAAAEMRNLVEGKTVQLEPDASQGDVDIYGRKLRYVWHWQTLINERLLQDGYAKEYKYRVPYKYMQRFVDAETKALVTAKGLWGACEHEEYR